MVESVLIKLVLHDIVQHTPLHLPHACILKEPVCVIAESLDNKFGGGHRNLHGLSKATISIEGNLIWLKSSFRRVIGLLAELLLNSSWFCCFCCCFSPDTASLLPSNLHNSWLYFPYYVLSFKYSLMMPTGLCSLPFHISHIVCYLWKDSFQNVHCKSNKWILTYFRYSMLGCNGFREPMFKVSYFSILCIEWTRDL